MNTRDIVLVGAGVAVGYLLVGYLNKPKNNAQSSTGSTEQMPEQDKLAECTKKVEDSIATTVFKTTANFDINAYKKEAIDRCLKGGAF